MTTNEIELLAVAVARAVADSMTSVMVPFMDSMRTSVDSLRADVFKAMDSKVSHESCERTHASLPPVLILTSIGAASVVSSAVTGVIVWAITQR